MGFIWNRAIPPEKTEGSHGDKTRYQKRRSVLSTTQSPEHAIMSGDGKRKITMDNSKTFRTEVRCGKDNYNDIPTVVEFIIEEATAAEIIRLATIVKANDLYKVERFDYRAKYLKFDPQEDPEDAKLAGEENEFRTEADVLNVSDQEFWFSAYIKHTDIEVLSEQLRIDDLVQRFDLEKQAASL
jgi:hypothetical protein